MSLLDFFKKKPAKESAKNNSVAQKKNTPPVGRPTPYGLVSQPAKRNDDSYQSPVVDSSYYAPSGYDSCSSSSSDSSSCDSSSSGGCCD